MLTDEEQTVAKLAHEAGFYDDQIADLKPRLVAFARAIAEKATKADAIAFAHQYLSVTDVMGYEAGPQCLSPEEFAANLKAKADQCEVIAEKAAAEEREACALAFEGEAETWEQMRKAGYLGAIKRKGAAAIRKRGEPPCGQQGHSSHQCPRRHILAKER